MSAGGVYKLAESSRPSSLSEASLPLINLSVSTPEAARILGYSSAALRKWRREGKGPRFIRHGRSVRYKLSDLRAWEDTLAIEPAMEVNE